MDQVDFGYIENLGRTIYSICFQRFLHAKLELKRPSTELRKLMSRTEIVFEYLVHEGDRFGFDVNSILEIPASNGGTCFSTASQNSQKISSLIIGREIKVNSIGTDMMVADFKYPDLAIQMMEKGVNPFVINYDGNSLIELYPSSFKSEESKRLIAKFPRSVHFTIDDINCSRSCPPDCSSSFKKFYFKNGEFLEMSDSNRIGQGGFGWVFKEKFHGQDKAMKCVNNGQIRRTILAKDAVSDFEDDISEIRIQTASGGPGVIVPEAFVRQQNQEQDESGKWIAENYNIFIYPLYDCNLCELHENHYDQLTDEILRDIMHQCLTRKSPTLTDYLIFE